MSGPGSPKGPVPDGGFVLVNALIMVAALAAIAVFLLSRAEGARARQAESQGAAQVTLYLDAFEALAISVLNTDAIGGDGVDHAGEVWALSGYDVPVDRGRVAGDLVDMQGRFNINWLANPEDLQAQDGFARLMARLGLSSLLADKISAFVSPAGPSDASAYARLTPAQRPFGGAILFVDQLLDIPDMAARDFARLRPLITALPADMPLNINTAPTDVLKSMLPGLSAVGADRLVQVRRLSPFVSAEDFALRLAEISVGAVPSEEDLPRFGVGSEWFEATIRAELDGRIRNRLTVLHRLPLPDGTQVAYRLGRAP